MIFPHKSVCAKFDSDKLFLLQISQLKCYLRGEFLQIELEKSQLYFPEKIPFHGFFRYKCKKLEFLLLCWQFTTLLPPGTASEPCKLRKRDLIKSYRLLESLMETAKKFLTNESLVLVFTEIVFRSAKIDDFQISSFHQM